MEVSVNVVNAFTANGKGGNPAGVVLDASSLTEKQMQYIAMKVNFSETAFVSKDSASDYVVRFFTPNTEVDLCGHATIASWYLLFRNGLPPGKYTQKTHAGELRITIDDNGLVFMEQPKAEFYKTVPPEDIARALGIHESDLSPSLQPQIVSTGLKDIIVPMSSKTALFKIKPVAAKLSALSEKYEAVGGYHAFTLLEDKGSLAVARNFAPELGILEESATGTANGALLCYLKDRQVIDGLGMYRIEQGENLGQLSFIYGKFIDDDVWVGGAAKMVEERVVDLI